MSSTPPPGDAAAAAPDDAATNAQATDIESAVDNPAPAAAADDDAAAADDDDSKMDVEMPANSGDMGDNNYDDDDELEEGELPDDTHNSLDAPSANHHETTAIDAEDPAKAQKIVLVIGRKRKADDEMTTVSSELHTPPSRRTPSDQAEAASGPASLVPSAAASVAASVAPAAADKEPEEEEDEDAAVEVDDTAKAEDSIKAEPKSSEVVINNTTATTTKSESRSEGKASAGSTTRYATPAEATPAPFDDGKPKRAPRKRRKWLRKGEVDPDDHKAVAEQKARHALIDAALEALDQQERLLLDGTHPQLVELWRECERRRDLQLKYNEEKFKRNTYELDDLFRQEMVQIRQQFEVSQNWQITLSLNITAPPLTLHLPLSLARPRGPFHKDDV